MYVKRPTLETVGSLIKETVRGWKRHNALQLGAALAYYAIFSIGPLILLLLLAVGAVLGESEAKRGFFTHFETAFGPEVTRAVADLAQAKRPGSGNGFVTVLGVLFVLVGATGMFAHVKRSLDLIWEVPRVARAGWKAFVRRRVFSFFLIVGIGASLLALFAFETAIASMTKEFQQHLPFSPRGVRGLSFLLSFPFLTFLIAATFKYLPETKLQWRDVFLGAALTALLFALGKWCFGWYLGKTGMDSLPGITKSFIVVLVAVFYWAQIFFIGAEFTKVYSARSPS